MNSIYKDNFKDLAINVIAAKDNCDDIADKVQRLKNIVDDPFARRLIKDLKSCVNELRDTLFYMQDIVLDTLSPNGETVDFNGITPYSDIYPRANVR